MGSVRRPAAERKKKGESRQASELRRNAVKSIASGQRDAVGGEEQRADLLPYPLPATFHLVQIDPEDNVKPKTYAQELSIPAEVAEERVVGKLLQLDPPEGKVSDRRKAELAVQEAEKEKKKKSKKNKAKTPAQLKRRERKAFLTSIPRSLPCVFPAFADRTVRYDGRTDDGCFPHN